MAKRVCSFVLGGIPFAGGAVKMGCRECSAHWRLPQQIEVQLFICSSRLLSRNHVDNQFGANGTTVRSKLPLPEPPPAIAVKGGCLEA